MPRIFTKAKNEGEKSSIGKAVLEIEVKCFDKADLTVCLEDIHS